MVVKRSGVTEPFSRTKVINGVRKACQGRPVTEDALAQLGQRVEEAVRATGSAELTTHDVGLAILGPLQELDLVAYLRFASVYRAFDSLEDFEAAIAELRERIQVIKELCIESTHATPALHPFGEVAWERRDVVMTNWRDGSVNFEQRGVEFPDFSSVNAVNIVTSQYFRGAVGTPQRETGLKQLIDRIAKTYRKAGEDHKHFAPLATPSLVQRRCRTAPAGPGLPHPVRRGVHGVDCMSGTGTGRKLARGRCQCRVIHLDVTVKSCAFPSS
jgi:hypothetical protein